MQYNCFLCVFYSRTSSWEVCKHQSIQYMVGDAQDVGTVRTDTKQVAAMCFENGIVGVGLLEQCCLWKKKQTYLSPNDVWFLHPMLSLCLYLPPSDRSKWQMGHLADGAERTGSTTHGTSTEPHFFCIHTHSAGLISYGLSPLA